MESIEQVQELLKPRYKVIALWIKSPLKINIGDIIQWDDLTNDFYCKGERFNKDLETYPHLFKPLQWWEERKESEMPEYVKLRTGQVLKCSNWRKENDYLIFNADGRGRNQRADDYYKPATKEEYETYISNLKQ